jgi:hypothetical protein
MTLVRQHPHFSHFTFDFVFSIALPNVLGFPQSTLVANQAAHLAACPISRLQQSTLRGTTETSTNFEAEFATQKTPVGPRQVAIWLGTSLMLLVV